VNFVRVPGPSESVCCNSTRARAIRLSDRQGATKCHRVFFARFTNAATRLDTEQKRRSFRLGQCRTPAFNDGVDSFAGTTLQRADAVDIAVSHRRVPRGLIVNGKYTTKVASGRTTKIARAGERARRCRSSGK